MQANKVIYFAQQKEAIKQVKIAFKYCKGVGKAYNQMNGGSANGDAFVN